MIYLMLCGHANPFFIYVNFPLVSRTWATSCMIRGDNKLSIRVIIQAVYVIINMM